MQHVRCVKCNTFDKFKITDLGGGRVANISSSSLRKPTSRRRSASSSTTILTSLTMSRNRAECPISRRYRPGVHTRISYNISIKAHKYTLCLQTNSSSLIKIEFSVVSATCEEAYGGWCGPEQLGGLCGDLARELPCWCDHKCSDTT